MSSPARCFQIHPDDNVATLLDDVSSGLPLRVLGQREVSVNSREPIKLGHKIALRDIATNQPVIKFGVPIGRASHDITQGQWVHLHNCASSVDERSQTLDLHTGAATDTKYE